MVQRSASRSPSSALLRFFGWEGSPTRTDTENTLLASLMEDLSFVGPFWAQYWLRNPFRTNERYGQKVSQTFSRGAEPSNGHSEPGTFGTRRDGFRRVSRHVGSKEPAESVGGSEVRRFGGSEVMSPSWQLGVSSFFWSWCPFLG